MPRRFSIPSELVPSEHASQTALFRWACMQYGAHPELRLLYAVPNAGKRSKWERGMALKEGLRSGVPDVVLPWPVLPFHGLYVEMKSLKKRSRVEPEQRLWLDWLRAAGYFTAICWTFEDAQRAILTYLKGDPLEQAAVAVLPGGHCGQWAIPDRDTVRARAEAAGR